jgi:hypothetical protein
VPDIVFNNALFAMKLENKCNTAQVKEGGVWFPRPLDVLLLNKNVDKEYLE